jgi:hypothetical protein
MDPDWLCVVCGGRVHNQVAGMCAACEQLQRHEITTLTTSLNMQQWLTSVLFSPLLPTLRSVSFVNVDFQPVPASLMDALILYSRPAWTEVMEMMVAPVCARGQCAVCLEEMENQPCVQLPCNHQFHRECADSWLQRRDTCPLCRDSLNERFAHLELD